jgi:hypothetical protein
VGARAHRCSPAMDKEDEQDEAVLEGCSLGYKWRWRGSTMIVKGGGGLSSAQERRKVREGSVERGNGAGYYRCGARFL